MFTLNDMDRAGSPWRVTQPLSASLDTALVTPKSTVMRINAQRGTEVLEGLTILGWTINATANASGGTVTLRSRDFGIAEGTATDDDIHVHTVPASSTIRESVTPCFIPLRHGGGNPTPFDGAQLEVVCSANITGGSLCIWGLLGTLGDINSFTGSPVDRS